VKSDYRDGWDRKASGGAYVTYYRGNLIITTTAMGWKVIDVIDGTRYGSFASLRQAIAKGNDLIKLDTKEGSRDAPAPMVPGK
jgi:hypothetical protein